MSTSTIGQRIANLLSEQRMTQRDLANRIGVTEVSVSRYISDDRVPKGTVIANIAKELHTTPNYLLGDEAEEDLDTEYIQLLRLTEKLSSFLTAEQKTTVARILFSAPNKKE